MEDEFCFPFSLRMYVSPPPYLLKTGKKAVKAVLWVSADGLRVVDEKTKVRLLRVLLISADKVPAVNCSGSVIACHGPKYSLLCPGNSLSNSFTLWKKKS